MLLDADLFELIWTSFAVLAVVVAATVAGVVSLALLTVLRTLRRQGWHQALLRLA